MLQLHKWGFMYSCIVKLWMIVPLPQGASGTLHTYTAISPTTISVCAYVFTWMVVPKLFLLLVSLLGVGSQKVSNTTKS